MPLDTDVEISRASTDDVPAIKEIAEQWRMGDRNESDLMDRGFLVSDFTVDDYKHLVASSDYCFVARRDGHIVGFLLAYSQAALKSIDDTTADWVGTRLDDFVVIKAGGGCALADRPRDRPGALPPHHQPGARPMAAAGGRGGRHPTQRPFPRLPPQARFH